MNDSDNTGFHVEDSPICEHCDRYAEVILVADRVYRLCEECAKLMGSEGVN